MSSEEGFVNLIIESRASMFKQTTYFDRKSAAKESEPCFEAEQNEQDDELVTKSKETEPAIKAAEESELNQVQPIAEAASADASSWWSSKNISSWYDTAREKVRI